MDTSVANLAAGSADQGTLGGFDSIAERMMPLARLDAETERLRAEYEAAKPYPHLVMDGFFDEEILDRIAEDFPSAGKRDWVTWDNDNEVKQTSRGIQGLSPLTQTFMMQLSSEPFLKRISAITGIDNILMDPLFHGGGLHESQPGGWLNMHADWTYHPILPLRRCFNLIIYVNRDWNEEWGGGLKLTHADHVDQGGPTVAPLFNRAVIFPTTEKTLHGFPDPITCPEGRTRKSISFFYWTPDAEGVSRAPNIAWMPGSASTKRAAFIRSCIPPILFNQIRKIKNKGK